MSKTPKEPVKIVVRLKEYEVDPGITMKQVFQRLSLFPEAYLALRNGELITEDDVVRSGEKVELIAVISGG